MLPPEWQPELTAEPQPHAEARSHRGVKGSETGRAGLVCLKLYWFQESHSSPGWGSLGRDACMFRVYFSCFQFRVKKKKVMSCLSGRPLTSGHREAQSSQVLIHGRTPGGNRVSSLHVSTLWRAEIVPGRPAWLWIFSGL